MALSHDFEVVSVGSSVTSTKSVIIDLPTPKIKTSWSDEVGNSYEKEVNKNAKKFNEVLEASFKNLVELDKSISLDNFKYNDYEIDNYINGLTVKR